MSEQHYEARVTESQMSGVEAFVNNLDTSGLDTKIETTRRFSLSRKGTSIDFLVPLNDKGGNFERFLATTPSDTDDILYEQLSVAGIAQLPRIKKNSEGFLYRVPASTKPLSLEGLFTSLPSTETYVSDVELFENLGKLWSTIYRATGRVATQGSISKVGLLDFEAIDGESLIPVPPYTSWQIVADEEVAKTGFVKSVQQELAEIDQRQSHEDLIQATKSGWGDHNDRPKFV